MRKGGGNLTNKVMRSVNEAMGVLNFREVIERIEEAFFLFSAEGRLLDLNQSACRLLDQAPDSLQGKDGSALFVDLDMQGLASDLVEQPLQSTARRECRLKRSDGQILAVEGHFARLEESSHELIFALVRDDTQRKHKEREGELWAHIDVLTRVPNRLAFQRRLAEEFARIEHGKNALTMLFLGLDRFKSVNDTAGYATGDSVLLAAAQRLTSLVSGNNLVARMGGDEFGVLLTDVSEPETAAGFARNVLERLAEPYYLAEGRFQVYASIGIAVVPSDGHDAESLLKNARLAMYQAKDLGRNGYQFFSADTHARAAYRQLVQVNLAQALERGEISVHYQPQLDLAQERLIGMEALMRWTSLGLGKVSPDKFIPVAEESDLILHLGDWIMLNSCRQARAWQQAGYPELRLAVNVSGRQFRQPGFAERVADILQQTGLPAHCLEIELTESCLVESPEDVRSILQQLRQLGVHIAVDDFGTGYSSLSYLKMFPLNRIKIDRSFVRDLDKDADDAAIVSAIIAMAHSLGMSVLAEGVETEQHLAFLRARNCDEVQGFYHSRPLSAADFEQFVKEHFNQTACAAQAIK